MCDRWSAYSPISLVSRGFSGLLELLMKALEGMDIVVLDMQKRPGR